MSKSLFSAQELKQIGQAVQEAEAQSAGEIMPVFLQSASFYETAYWRGSFLFAAVVAVVLSLLYFFTDVLLFAPPYLWLVFVLASGALGALLVYAVPAFKRMLLGKDVMVNRTVGQAKNMFYDYQVMGTEQRSGILLFISFFERQAIILPDIGLAELVEEQQWQKIVDTLVQGISRQQITDSICQAIHSCGQLLQESGLQSTADENQLPDQLRQEP